MTMERKEKEMVVELGRKNYKGNGDPMNCNHTKGSSCQ